MKLSSYLGKMPSLFRAPTGYVYYRIRTQTASVKGFAIKIPADGHHNAKMGRRSTRPFVFRD